MAGRGEQIILFMLSASASSTIKSPSSRSISLSYFLWAKIGVLGAKTARGKVPTL